MLEVECRKKKMSDQDAFELLIQKPPDMVKSKLFGKNAFGFTLQNDKNLYFLCPPGYVRFTALAKSFYIITNDNSADTDVEAASAAKRTQVVRKRAGKRSSSQDAPDRRMSKRLMGLKPDHHGII